MLAMSLTGDLMRAMGAALLALGTVGGLVLVAFAVWLWVPLLVYSWHWWLG